MKTSAFLLLAISGISHAHTMAQRVSVNDNDNGQLVGIRSPSSNNPIGAVINKGLVLYNNTLLICY